MTATLSTEQFNHIISRILHCVPEWPTIAVLSGIALITETGALRAVAGDRHAGTALIPARDVRPGAALVQGRLLAAIARHLPDARTTLGLDRASRLLVDSGPVQYRLLTMPWEDFPLHALLDRATVTNHANAVKPTKLIGPWKPTRTKLWAGPRRTRTPFTPAPFGTGDWVKVTDPRDGTVHLGQIWNSRWMVLQTPDGTRFHKLSESRNRNGPPWICFQQQTGGDDHGQPRVTWHSATLERTKPPDSGSSLSTDDGGCTSAA